MAEIAGDIAVRVGADVGPLKRGLASGESSLDSFGKKAADTGKNIGLVAAAAAAAGAAIVAGLVVNGLAAVDALNQMAERSGSSVKSIQSLSLAWGEAGVSSEQTEKAIKKLSISIGNAQAGNVAANATFDKLGLSVSKLSGMDADQRMATISDAVAKFGNSADKAAISAELFGERFGPNITAAMAMGGDAIRQASADIDAMGLAISDIDAAKVDTANESFDRAKSVVGGVANKLAVELAPYLDAASKAFIEAGKDGEGFGGMISSAISGAIKAVSFLANAFDGIKRVFSIVADSLIYGFSAIQETAYKLAYSIVDALDAIPGVDLTSNVRALEERIKTSQVVMAEAAASIRGEFEKPMAGDQFKAWAESAKTASAEAAAAAVAAREAAQGGTANAPTEEDPAVQRARDTAEKIKIEEEKKAKSAAEAAAMAREVVAADRAAGLMDLENSLKTERTLLEESFAEKRNQILVANEQGIGDRVANNLLIEDLAQQHSDKMAEIDQKAADEKKKLDDSVMAARLSVVSAGLNLAAALNDDGSKKAFEKNKKFGIGQALISAYVGIGQAWALGPILGPPAAVAVGLGAFANIAKIRSQKFGGGGGGAGSPAAAPSAGGGGGSGSGGEQQNQQRQNTNVTLVGDTFGGGALVEMLNKLKIDGYTFAGA